MARKRPGAGWQRGNDVFKIWFCRQIVFSKAIGVSLAVMLGMSLAGAPVVKAEQSDEMREFIKKQKLKSKGLLGTYTPSSRKVDPIPSGKAVTKPRFSQPRSWNRCCPWAARLKCTLPRASMRQS